MVGVGVCVWVCVCVCGGGWVKEMNAFQKEKKKKVSDANIEW